MITWIQKTFHEHFRFVFIALLVASIVAFIFVNNASVGFGLFQSRAEKRPYFGVNLAESGAFERIQKDTVTSVYFQFGSAPPKNDHLHRLAMKRFALVYTADQTRLPHPTSVEVEERVKTLRYFKGADGQFDASKYAYFCISPKTNTGLDLTLADFTRAIGDDMRLDSLQKLVSGPGYVLPQEVRQIIKQNETTWTLISANVDFRNTLSEVDASESQIVDYFGKNRPKYAIAPQVRVDYIEFPSSLFLNFVSVTEEEVRAYYDANPTRFPKALAIANTPQAHDQNYALVRPNAEALLRQQRAQVLATTAAGDLTIALHKGGILPGTLEFNELLETSQVVAKPLHAFSKDTPPAMFERNGATVATESFALSAETRYSNPVKTSRGVVVFVWQESIPERPAAFSEIVEKVRCDYINEQRQNQMFALGKRIKQRVEADIKAGLPFPIAMTKAAVADGVVVTTQNHAPFALRQHTARRHEGPNALNVDRSLMDTLRYLEQGQMSDMIINGDTGRFIYVHDAKHPDLAETNPEYVRMERDMAAPRAKATFDAFVTNIVDAELNKSVPKQTREKDDRRP